MDWLDKYRQKAQRLALRSLGVSPTVTRTTVPQVAGLLSAAEIERLSVDDSQYVPLQNEAGTLRFLMDLDPLDGSTFLG